jgi:hypothetical protein
MVPIIHEFLHVSMGAGREEEDFFPFFCLCYSKACMDDLKTP